MAQHFLMSAAARTLALVDLCDLSEDAAHSMLCAMRWPDTDGAPICPKCSRAAVLYLSVSPGVQMQGLPSAVFGDQRNLARVPEAAGSDAALAFSFFVNAAKGISRLQLSRYLGLHAKTAFVLLHKLRCALTSNVATTRLSGVAEIDGGCLAAMSGQKITGSLALIGADANTKAASGVASW